MFLSDRIASVNTRYKLPSPYIACTKVGDYQINNNYNYNAQYLLCYVINAEWGKLEVPVEETWAK